ncbi:MAG: hypothetical protein QM528_02140 [Phycisphaerales bacterium]|nr:hypothetical protein [Phycisphaerales bacterium]
MQKPIILILFFCFLFSCKKSIPGYPVIPPNDEPFSPIYPPAGGSANGVIVGLNSSGQGVYSYTTDGGQSWSIAKNIAGFSNMTSVAFAK